MYASMIPHSVLSCEGGGITRGSGSGVHPGTNLAPECKIHTPIYQSTFAVYMKHRSSLKHSHLYEKSPSIVNSEPVSLFIPDIQSLHHPTRNQHSLPTLPYLTLHTQILNHIINQNKNQTHVKSVPTMHSTSPSPSFSVFVWFYVVKTVKKKRKGYLSINQKFKSLTWSRFCSINCLPPYIHICGYYYYYYYY